MNSEISSAAYTPIAKGLHWLMALLIAGLLAVGLYMHDLPLSPDKLALYAWHKWAGVTVFGLVWIRLIWRWTHPPAELPASVSPLMKKLAFFGHGTLYVLMLLIPLSGWLMSSAKGFQTVWFGVVPIPDLVSRHRELGDALQLTHQYLNVALMVVLAGHVGAAVWHHLVLKDDVLKRMG